MKKAFCNLRFFAGVFFISFFVPTFMVGFLLFSRPTMTLASEYDELVLHMDEVRDAVLVDSSGKGNNFLWYYDSYSGGSQYPIRCQGKFDVGLKFDGSGVWAGGVLASPISIANGFSGGFWLKTSVESNDSKDAFWFSSNSYGSDPGNGIVISLISGKMQLTSRNGNDWVNISSDTAVNDDAWHFISFSYSNGSDELTLYVDGKEQKSAIRPIDLTVINRAVLSQRFLPWADVSHDFNGSMDDVWLRSSPASSEEMSAIYFSGQPYESEIVTPSSTELMLQSYYRFDESGVDEVVSGRDLAWGYNVYGGGEANPRYVSGRFSSAVNFKKVDDVFDQPRTNLMDYSSGLSIGSWVRATDSSDPGARLVWFGWEIGRYEIPASHIGIEENRGFARVVAESDGHWFYVDSINPINDGQWHYIVGVFDPRSYSHSMKLFVDGVFQGESFFISPKTPPEMVRIGYRENYYCGSVCNFSGDIDDMFFVSGVMSDDEVLRMYSADKPYGEIGQSEKIKVAVVLAETKDIKHLSTPITAQPCKLIPEKTYQNGHDKEYYEDLLYCVKDYHCENSFGKMNEQGECVGGLVDLEFDIYDNEDEWYQVDKNEEEYVGNSGLREFLNNVFSVVTFTDLRGERAHDVLFAVHSGYSSQVDKEKTLKTAVTRQKEVVIAENDGIYFWVHEISHVLGDLLIAEPNKTFLPDLYGREGNVDGWDVMGKADLYTNFNNPPLLSSYLKEFLGWNGYEVCAKSDYGTYWIDSLEQYDRQSKIFRYNLEDSKNENVSKYYIFEARNKSLGNWDSALPNDKALLLYYVDEKGTEKYGYDEKGAPFSYDRHMGIPGNGDIIEGAINNGVFKPGTDHEFLDFENLLRIGVGNDRFYDGKYQIEARIEDFNPNFVQTAYYGVIFNTDNTLRSLLKKSLEFFDADNKIDGDYSYIFGENGLLKDSKKIIIALRVGYFVGALISIITIFIFAIIYFKLQKKKKPNWFFRVSILIPVTIFSLLALNMILLLSISFGVRSDNEMKKYPNMLNFIFRAPSLDNVLEPDLDLHLYCDDGRHVGVNYETGEYEIDIPEAETIGDGQGSREWIFIPEEYRNQCHFVVSSYDDKKFLEANPDVAGELGGDVDEKYKIYARRIDPNSGIYTSEELTGEIAPGVMIEHKVSGSDNIEIFNAEAFDMSNPTTTISVSGQLGGSGYYVSPVEIELSGNDGLDGSGILKTEYSLDGGETWLEYANKIVLFIDGVYALTYRSVDKAGNKEEMKEVMIKIDQTAPDITMIMPQDGQEVGHDAKLNVEYLADDSVSGLQDGSEVIYFDGQTIDSNEIDLFKEPIGQHKVKVAVRDQAGNLAEKEVSFEIITTIAGTISDITRANSEGYLNQKAKDALVADLNDIQRYLDKNAEREEKRQDVEDGIMANCVAKKGQAWCDEKLGDVFEKIDYHLTVVQKKLLLVKYKLILKKLELYEKLGWMTEVGGGVLSGDIEYLMNF